MTKVYGATLVTIIGLFAFSCSEPIGAPRVNRSSSVSTPEPSEGEVSPEDDVGDEGPEGTSSSSSSTSGGSTSGGSSSGGASASSSGSGMTSSSSSSSGGPVIIPSIHEGKLVGAPGRPLALVTKGQRVNFEVLATAAHFGSSLDHTPLSVAEFDAIPSGVDILRGQAVLGFTGRPAAFFAKGKLHPVSCLTAITDNQSTIESRAIDPYLTLQVGFTLTCTR
jgi:hypothetical protein